MAIDETTIQFSFAVDDPSLDDEQQQEIAQGLLRQLRKLDEVEQIERTENLNIEVGAKPGFATLVGMLTAKVSVKNIGAFLGFLGDRLGDKPVVVNVKAGDKEVKIEAKSRQELLEAERVAKELLASIGGSAGA